ncbi:MAG: polymerase subunit delta [Rickettsiaceae bacterium]|jgi:DNA polymerase-3 subunit delta'|nr:polymerase subunit delta [Rickettsiaceae bacterium]
MKLFGFNKIEKSLLDNFNNNNLHHGLLFTGGKGIGKASFVLDFATKILLSSSKNQEEDLKKIQQQSHPDLLIVKKDQKKRDISVEAVREISQFLSLTSAISKHRVIIIDAVDDLNKNSNNAILKTLEEPPQNVFIFLVNHNQRKLLDTIKSRCRTIKISSPSYEDFKTVLKKNFDGIDEEEIRVLAKISDNSIGSAIEMKNYGALELYNQIEQLALENNKKEVFNLAKSVAGSDESWTIFEKLVIFYFYNLLYQHLSGANQQKIFTALDKVNNLFLVTRNLNLDKSQSVINIFNMLGQIEKLA